MCKINRFTLVSYNHPLFPAGMSSVDRKGFGRIGLRAFSYYTVTTLIAAFTGIALASVIQPGTSSRNPPTPSGGKVEAVQSVDAFLDLIRCV